MHRPSKCTFLSLAMHVIRKYISKQEKKMQSTWREGNPSLWGTKDPHKSDKCWENQRKSAKMEESLNKAWYFSLLLEIKRTSWGVLCGRIQIFHLLNLPFSCAKITLFYTRIDQFVHKNGLLCCLNVMYIQPGSNWSCDTDVGASIGPLSRLYLTPNTRPHRKRTQFVISMVVCTLPPPAWIGAGCKRLEKIVGSLQIVKLAEQLTINPCSAPPCGQKVGRLLEFQVPFDVKNGKQKPMDVRFNLLCVDTSKQIGAWVAKLAFLSADLQYIIDIYRSEHERIRAKGSLMGLCWHKTQTQKLRLGITGIQRDWNRFQNQFRICRRWMHALTIAQLILQLLITCCAAIFASLLAAAAAMMDSAKIVLLAYPMCLFRNLMVSSLSNIPEAWWFVLMLSFDCQTNNGKPNARLYRLLAFAICLHNTRNSCSQPMKTRDCTSLPPQAMHVR